MATLQELLAQKAELEKQILETQRNERAEAINRVRALMAEHGLSAADIAFKSSASAKSGNKSGSTQKVAPKYRNPETGETWTGRGLQPKWLKAAIAGGAKLPDFAV